MNFGIIICVCNIKFEIFLFCIVFFLFCFLLVFFFCLVLVEVNAIVIDYERWKCKRRTRWFLLIILESFSIWTMQRMDFVCVKQLLVFFFGLKQWKRAGCCKIWNFWLPLFSRISIGFQIFNWNELSTFNSSFLQMCPDAIVCRVTLKNSLVRSGRMEAQWHIFNSPKRYLSKWQVTNVKNSNFAKYKICLQTSKVSTTLSGCYPAFNRSYRL